MGVMASQITSFLIVYSTIYSGADQRKHQSSTSLAIVRGIHRWPVNSQHKGLVMRKMFPFDNVIMKAIFNISCPQNQNKQIGVTVRQAKHHAYCAQYIKHNLGGISLRNESASSEGINVWKLMHHLNSYMNCQYFYIQKQNVDIPTDFFRNQEALLVKILPAHQASQNH